MTNTSQGFGHFSVTLPGCSKANLLPLNWEAETSSSLIRLSSPENDLWLMLTRSKAAGIPEEIAIEAWRHINPTFAHEILQISEVPAPEGWEKAYQVMYRTSEDTIRIALLYLLADEAYVALIECAKGALSRRMAQVAEILEAWWPEGRTRLSLSQNPAQPWSEHESQQLETFIEEGMRALRIPAVSVAVVQKGQIVYSDGFGDSRLGIDSKVSSKTRFMIGSATKPLTSLMMAILVDRGLFDWSTRVSDLLPGFRLGDIDVTDRLELGHTVGACTGMPRRDLDFVFKFKKICPEQRLAEMATMRPTTGFGETFQYSNLLVAAGGYAAAHALHPELPLAEAYKETIKSLILTPLRMKDSFVKAEEALAGDAASPHAIGLDGQTIPLDPGVEQFVDSIAPAGALWSSALDMAEYLRLELSSGTDRQACSLLSKEALESRWRGGIKITDSSEYGLGLLQRQEHGIEVIGHGGNTLGFSSDMWFMPSHGLGMVVLTNMKTANAFLAAIKQRFFELVFGAPEKALENVKMAVRSAKETEEARALRVKMDEGSTRWLNDFIDDYECEELGRCHLFHDDQRFVARFESWECPVGIENSTSGERLIILAGPPLLGTRLRVISSGDLEIDSGQIKYVFRRVKVTS